MRKNDKAGSSGVKERIIAPAADWQEVHFDWDNIGAGRARLGIEALWHADSIYFDDVQVSDRSTDPTKIVAATWCEFVRVQRLLARRSKCQQTSVYQASKSWRLGGFDTVTLGKVG